ncbi:hypothetical protein U472_09610 [Orenia metallireducens]|uniref:Uncharacterized protein n=1 Tax=Orenia metallireducens TaxID=1413210 RepID=A0A1C0A7P5_9FIRM|nr:hypothetical protein [Orenia metallireducens]OCL26257.1 hypothetical protein U472_09610 [Orenia metallireducens]
MDKEGNQIVVFESINVNSINTLSGIFVGDNLQCFWRAQNKLNSGFGEVKGEGNLVLTPFNVVADPDCIDNPSIYHEMEDNNG